MENNINEMKSKITLGKGAKFWGYISPMNNTEKNATKWRIEIRQKDGNWADAITSDKPFYQPQTPGLSGIFQVTVIASGPKMKEKKLTNLPDSKPDVGCNSNCAAMIGIVSNEDGTDANYWTVWDAFCNKI